MKKKIKKRQNNNLEEKIESEYNNNAIWCVKSGKASSYTFNSYDPSMPFCKATGPCEFKVENYTPRPNCLKMHEIYGEELDEIYS